MTRIERKEHRLNDEERLPQYLPGDTIRISFVVEHETHLEEMGAWFILETDEEGVEQEIFLLGPTYEEERSGPQIRSRVELEQTITHENTPGVYQLRNAAGFSSEGTRRYRIQDVPNIRFRVLPEPKTNPRVLSWSWLETS